MTVFLLSLGVFAVFFLLMSVRLLFIKDGEFRGTCATQSPFLAKEGITCGYSGKVVARHVAIPKRLVHFLKSRKASFSWLSPPISSFYRHQKNLNFAVAL
jgi:hypothetical protein